SQAGAQGVTIRVCALEQQSAIHEQKEKHE
ncbi:MAG: hypothetical protein RLZZ386_886, partial [Planctomycetota bacterium]